MIGYSFCGSFCTLGRSLKVLRQLASEGNSILPIMSDSVYATDTRFGKAEELIKTVEGVCGRRVVHTIVDAEPIGPKMALDMLVICPCTGNTLAKLANGITDSAVTMAAKAHLRNGRPLVIAFSTNDGLSGSAENIGRLLNRTNYYFVPFGQDDAEKKPCSLQADFSRLAETVEAALRGEQLQPVLR